MSFWKNIIEGVVGWHFSHRAVNSHFYFFSGEFLTQSPPKILNDRGGGGRPTSDFPDFTEEENHKNFVLPRRKLPNYVGVLMNGAVIARLATVGKKKRVFLPPSIFARFYGADFSVEKG